MNELTKNFLLGIGSILSIFPSAEASDSVSGYQKDQERLANDWSNIGNDIYLSMDVVRNEQQETEGQ